MNNSVEELKTIKRSTLKYVFPLILFIAIYPAFIIYDVHFVFQFAFIAGLIFFSFSYDRLEKELNQSLMKNHYVKSKIGLKINELEQSLESSNKEYSIKMLQTIFNDLN